MKRPHFSQVNVAFLRHGKDAYLKAIEDASGDVSSIHLDMLYDYLFDPSQPTFRELGEQYGKSGEGCRKVITRAARIVETYLSRG